MQPTQTFVVVHAGDAVGQLASVTHATHWCVVSSQIGVDPLQVTLQGKAVAPPVAGAAPAALPPFPLPPDSDPPEFAQQTDPADPAIPVVPAATAVPAVEEVDPPVPVPDVTPPADSQPGALP